MPSTEPRAWWTSAPVPCGILVLATDGEVVDGNDEVCAILGRGRGELAGLRFQQFLSGDSLVVYQSLWETLLRVEGEARELKLHLVREDGSAVPVLVNARSLETAGRQRYVLAVFVAHHRDRYEKDLRGARDQAEELARQRRLAEQAQEDRARLAEQLIGIVSHDLRNPLLTIRMAAEQLPGGQSELVRHIVAAATRAQNLVKDLLDFTNARLRAGLSTDLAPLDLHRVVADQVAALGWAFPQARLVHRAEGEGACEADAARLAQLVGNLVANAVAYGDMREPVTVTSRVTADAFTVAVHNEGLPIPEELRHRIFEPLVRGPDGSEGVGLGLFIVAQIVRAHAGEVAVRSAAGEGTTFVATFPR